MSVNHMNIRVTFELPEDDSGYPPASSERLWAKPLPNGNYELDNSPFYVAGVSTGDEVEVDDVDGELLFRGIVVASGNSTFRLFLFDPTTSDTVRADLAALGCRSEFNQDVGVIAVEIPASLQIQPFLDYIMAAKEADLIDIDEGVLRHQI